MNSDFVVNKISQNVAFIEMIALGIISMIVIISSVFMIRSVLFRSIDDVYSSHENKLRAKYKRDNYFGPDHPDHFDYQRKVGGLTYFPNTKKAKQYYKQKRKVQNHQRNYKGYNRNYKKRYKKKRRY